MANMTAPTTVPYDAIITQLLTHNEIIREKVRANGTAMACGRAQWLRDYCTIRVGVGRLSGKTTWIYRHVESTDVVVVSNENYRRALVESQGLKYEANQAQYVVPNGIGIGGVPLEKRLTVFTKAELTKQFKERPRTVINLSLDPDDPNPQAQVDAAIADYRRRRTQYRAGHKFNRFIVDEASFAMEDLSVKEFYHWVDAMAHTVDPTIIMLG